MSEAEPPAAGELYEFRDDSRRLAARVTRVPQAGDACCVLVHGLLSDKDAALNVKMCAYFEPLGLNCIRVDLQGNGDSSGVWRLGTSYARDVDDVHLVVRSLRDLGAGVSVLFGHSRGANTVLMYAAAHCLAGPALAVVAFAPRFDMAGLVRRYLSAEQEQTIERTGRVMFRPPWGGEREYEATSDDLAAVRAIDNARVAHALDSAAGVLRVLLCHGESDAIIPIADAHAYAAHMPHVASLVCVPGTGHMFKERRAKAAFTAARDFCAAPPPPPALS